MVKRRRAAQISPQFFKIILSPHASKLHIPDEFVIKYGADLRDVVFLELPTGAIWQVKLQNSNGTKWLNDGWNLFKDYYSIACGYFLLFQYNGNSHFSVFIFDLSASEIEYPSGPNDATHGEKAGRPEPQNNAKVANPSYSNRQKSGIPVSRPSCLPERQEPNRVKLEKPDVEEDLNYATQKDKRKNLYGAADKGNENCNEVVLDPSASNMTNTTKCNKRKYPLNLEASRRRYPLRSKQVKLEQSKENGSPSCSGKQRPAATLSCLGIQSERKESTRMKLDKANSEEDICCAVPKAKSGETNIMKLVKQDRQHNMYDDAYKFKGHCIEVPVVDPSTSKVTTTNQHTKKKTATSLDASNCRYPLRSKQLKEVKIGKGDVKEHCNKIPVVDPSATKTTTTSRHHKKKTSASLDTPHCRYPLRSKQLKELKLEKTNAEDDLLYVAQRAKRKKANNMKLEKGDVEECCKVGDPSASTTINRHNEKKTTTILDASHCRYPLRSKQHKEVKLEQWEAGGNMHNKTPKNKVVADSPYCKRQNSGLPASSASCQPIRVKLETPENLFCAAEKAKGKETNNVKRDTGDMEGNLSFHLLKRLPAIRTRVAYKGKDSSASEMTILGKKKMLPSEKHSWDIYFNPHFTISMQPAFVSGNFRLDIHGDFFKKLFNEEETIVNLRVSNGRTWRAKLFDIQSNCAKIESSGWRDFVLGNNLKEHDTCVFELIDGIEPVLDVTIFRATTPVS